MPNRLLTPSAGYSVMHSTVSYGWDTLRNFLYCAPVGGGLLRLKIPEGTTP